MAKNPRRIDLEGLAFGKWSVYQQAGNEPRGGTLWFCKCACGTERIVRGGDLRNGKSVSCGCEGSRASIGQRVRKHGMTGTRLYTIWKGMHSRCNDLLRPNYGSKGITVCEEWATFEAFQSWAEASGYRDNLTIERLDSNGNYCHDNCIWADRTVQSRNRNIVRRAPDGRAWAEIAASNGIPPKVYLTRVHSGGWSDELAASWPLGMRRITRERDEAGRYKSQPATWRR